jgi:hypothetical protein
VLTPAAAARRFVHFNPITITTQAASGGHSSETPTLRHRQGHPFDPNDPFIDSTGNARAGSSRIFSSNIQVCLYFLI